jgi:large subunit ribosomal protein L5
MSVLKKHYTDVVVPELKKLHGYTNPHLVPKLLKVVINSGVNSNLDSKSAAEETAAQIALITGRKAIITTSKKSIANFKLRIGLPVGVKVTLRGDAMYNFFYELVNVALPAIRDFRGVSTRFDGKGNYTLGIADHTIFPEINIDSAKRVIGMDITFVTSASTDAEATDLLRLLGMPFRKRS